MTFERSPERLQDPRRRQGQRYPLRSVVVISLMAIVCGADDAEATFSTFAAARLRSMPSVIDVTLTAPVSGQSSVVTGTPEHPFYLPALDVYVPLGALRIGDEVLASDSGVTVVVSAVARRAGSFAVYNLEVETGHNYFVGGDDSPAVSALVHNDCIPGRVRSRINLANGRTRYTPLRNSGYPMQAGWRHVVDGHFNRQPANNRSVFTISENELRSVLQSPEVVGASVNACRMGCSRERLRFSAALRSVSQA